MSAYRYTKHFIVTWENGIVRVSQAKEIVPNRTYEILQHSKPLGECIMNFHPTSTSFKPPYHLKGLDLGERLEKNSCLS
jgi:hypothetical protein